MECHLTVRQTAITGRTEEAEPILEWLGKDGSTRLPSTKVGLTQGKCLPPSPTEIGKESIQFQDLHATV